MSFYVEHALPGRLRIRRRGPVRSDLHAVRERLESIAGIAAVTVSEKTGGILIHYENAAAEESIASLLDLPVRTLPCGRLGSHVALVPYVPLKTETSLRKDGQEDEAGLPLAGTEENTIESGAWCFNLGGTVLTTLISPLLPMPLRIGLAAWRAWPFLYHGVQQLAKGRLSVDVLDATAIAISLARRDFLSVTIVTTLLDIGEELEEWTRRRSYETLAQSLSSRVDTVWIRREGEDGQIHLSDLRADDRIIVRTGTTLPVDGVVEEGEALVNQVAMTGEPLPVLRRTGHMVYEGTTLEEGFLLIKPFKIGEDTHFRQIVNFIERSESMKAEAQSRSEKLAQRMVPFTFLLAGLVWAFTRDARKAASVLLVDYSCALKLVTPLAILSGMREGARHGILIRGGRFLEAMASADTVVFDKTGTLTQACPRVAKVTAFKPHTRDDVLRLAACLEEHFPHPVARAVVHQAEAEELHHTEEHNEVEYVVAHGVVSQWRGQRVLIGSRHFVHEDEHIPISSSRETLIREESSKGRSLLYLAIGGKLAGILSIEDPLRPEAPAIIEKLRADGIRRVVMLTGDNELTSRAISDRLGLDEFHSRLMPQDKVNIVSAMKDKGWKVIMVGDGLNDAPALSAAAVGVAMRDGADLAREVADVILDHNDLEDLLTARQLAKAVLGRIGSHYQAIIGLNSVFLGVGLSGTFPPGLAALLHNVTTVGTALSAMRPFLSAPSSSVPSSSDSASSISVREEHHD